MLLVVSAKS